MRSTSRREAVAGAAGEASPDRSTAELALALPTLMLILVAVGIWLQSAVALQARCQDAARAGARAAARGDPDATIRSALGAALPAGAHVGISRAGGR